MTDAEWNMLDLKGKIEAISACADIIDGCSAALILRRIVEIGEDNLSIDTILKAILRCGEAL